MVLLLLLVVVVVVLVLLVVVVLLLLHHHSCSWLTCALPSVTSRLPGQRLRVLSLAVCAAHWLNTHSTSLCCCYCCCC